jgi:hypothetical protein
VGRGADDEALAEREPLGERDAPPRGLRGGCARDRGVERVGGRVHARDERRLRVRADRRLLERVVRVRRRLVCQCRHVAVCGRDEVVAGRLEMICSGLRPGLGLADRASRHHITWAAPSFFSQPTFCVLACSTQISPVNLRVNDIQDRSECAGVSDVFCFADSRDFAYVSASKHDYH